MDRERQIVRASLVNVAGNVMLAVAKGAAGVASGSIAIVLDAVNSLTDVLSSVIAIIGAKLARKSANHDHPFGFGRMEYLAAIAISAIVLSAGLSSFVEAVRAIIRPVAPRYGFVSLGIVGVAALVKRALAERSSSIGSCSTALASAQPSFRS